MADAPVRKFFVLTLHGQAGPFALAELRTGLTCGEFAADDQVRSPFGRPLGTVQEVLAAARRSSPSGGQARISDCHPALPSGAPSSSERRVPMGLLACIGALLAIAALLAFGRGGEAPAPPPSADHARPTGEPSAPPKPVLEPVVVAKPVAPAPTIPGVDVDQPKTGPPPLPQAPVAPPVTAAAVLATDDQVWLEDALPSGATSHESSVVWNWTATTDPTPFSGRLALSGRGREGQFSCLGAVPLRITPGDTLFAHVWIDPQSPPDSLMLKWHDGQSWEHRAYWGRAGYSKARDKRHGNVRMGDLPQAGTWVRLEVPAARVGLEDIDVIGLSLGHSGGGRVLWDCAGRRPAR